MLGMAVLVALVIVGAIMGYIRFSPSDPNIWHLDPNRPGFVPPKGAVAFCPGPESRYSFPEADLSKLLKVADNWPRTERLAGSAEDGRVTDITRSRIMGYPDYTTIALRDVDGTKQICLIARQRFGREDFGVNTGRIQNWLAQAYDAFPEPPPMTWAP